MRNLSLLIISFCFVINFTLFAQDSTKSKINSNQNHIKLFVDKNGDGYNDNAPDADGDGIPNGKDPDYTPLKDSSGRKYMNNGRGKRSFKNGDKRGVCNGTGPRGNRGVCDGTGPKGNRSIKNK